MININTQQQANLSNITIHTLGKLAQSYAKGEIQQAISEKLFKDNLVVEDYKTMVELADSIYIQTCLLMELKITQGQIENVDELKAQADTVRTLYKQWFMAFGSKEPAKQGKGRRPMYSITDADWTILGKNCEFARQKADATGHSGDLKAIGNYFFEVMFLVSGKMLNGDSLGLVDEKDIKNARKIATQKATEKAKETKVKNEKKAKEQKKQEAETQATIDKLTKENEELKANTINITELINRINATSATDVEKTELVAWITSCTVQQ